MNQNRRTMLWASILCILLLLALAIPIVQNRIATSFSRGGPLPEEVRIPTTPLPAAAATAATNDALR